MNIFENLQLLQDSYSTYVFTFQKFKNPVIREWVHDRIHQGTLLWKDPFIQLNRRFAEGKTLEKFVDEGVLHSKCLKIFSQKPSEETSPPIIPYKHQSEAISALLEKEHNVIITTGTGSGKSFCFGIPIVNECLQLKEKAIDGIKAIIVYPMNALANSQYENFSERLHGSGLKIAIYTGDTKNSREEALRNLKEVLGREEPWDSEVLSREEIQENPPDILMTNYVMLDLILTRFEDRKLLPVHHRERLKFLVFDEIHTYSGKRGADVACLIRRLKERTQTIGKIRCIGTSATVQSGEGENAQQIIAEFSEGLFGEQFDLNNVIGETYIPISLPEPAKIPTHASIKEELVTEFDGSLEYAKKLIISLFKDETIANLTSEEELGEKLLSHPATSFLVQNLLETTQSLTNLAKMYRKQFRPNVTIHTARLELQAALLAGTVAKIQISGEWQLIFTPKIHTFFSQGRTITSCLTPSGPHLNDRGEVICAVCSEHGKTMMNFPLHFCRACGQEFYGVTILNDNSFVPRELDITETDGKAVYVLPYVFSEDDVPLPDEWMTPTQKLEKNYREAIPRVNIYCPICNQIEPTCSHPERLQVTIVPVPFLFCPSCGVYYNRRPREFSKLFTFGTVGRSTGTDVLVSSLLEGLPEDQSKVIAFSDSRQDTALQAAHLNDLQKRIHFRRGLSSALIAGEYNEKTGRPLPINIAGLRIFEIFKHTNTMPSFSKAKAGFRRNLLDEE